VLNANPAFVIPAEQTAIPVPVAILPDARAEALRERFRLRITGAEVLGAAGGTLEATAAVIDDDQPFVAIADLRQPEAGGTAQFEVRLVNAQGAPTISSAEVGFTARTYDGGAQAGLDYEALAGQFAIVAGAASVLVPVPILDDALYEGDESFRLELDDLVNAAGNIADRGRDPLCIIVDDEPSPFVTLTADSDEGSEGGAITITVALSAPIQTDLSFSLERQGEAAEGQDYRFNAAGLPLLIPAGRTGADFQIDLLDDQLRDEGSESLRVRLADVSPALPVFSDQVDLAILDAPLLTLTGGDPAEEGQALIFTARLSGASTAEVQFAIRLTNYTASAEDYESPGAGPFTIAAGSLETVIAIPAREDHMAEVEYELFAVTLDAAANAVIEDPRTAFGMIQDLDFPCLYVAAIDSLEGDSGQKIARFTVRLHDRAGQDVPDCQDAIVFNAQAAGIEATAGEDFLFSPGLFIIAPGSGGAISVDAQILGDLTPEPDERFRLTLSGYDPLYVRGTCSDNEPICTILNDD
jgi:hypothetical protein